MERSYEPSIIDFLSNLYTTNKEESDTVATELNDSDRIHNQNKKTRRRKYCSCCNGKGKVPTITYNKYGHPVTVYEFCPKCNQLSVKELRKKYVK